MVNGATSLRDAASPTRLLAPHKTNRPNGTAYPPAQDHEVIGIGDKASAKTLLKAELMVL